MSFHNIPNARITLSDTQPVNGLCNMSIISYFSTKTKRKHCQHLNPKKWGEISTKLSQILNVKLKNVRKFSVYLITWPSTVFNS